MKKSVLALILFAVIIIIVSPGLIGRLAEDSVGENLNWAAEESGELVVTSEGFDRGWFSSEGQHRVALGEGSIRAAMATAGSGEPLPVLLIDTHIDHGLVPVSSLGRDEGSLTPGLGSAVSTLSVDFGTGEAIRIPGVIYSEISLGGDLDSSYVLDAGAQTVDDGEVTWQPTTINIASSARTGDVEFEGDVGAMTFGNDQQTVSIDGLTFTGQQSATKYGFHVGDLDASVGAMAIETDGVSVDGMKGLNIKASSSVDDGLVDAAMRFEMSGQTVPGFGDISAIIDMDFTDFDAVALGKATQHLDQLTGAPEPSQALLAAEEDFQGLFAAGFDFGVNQFDVALPMGTVEMKMTIAVPETDRSAFEWSSLLLNAVASVDIVVPEALVQLATSMNPQAGALVGLGYLKKDGDVYILDGELKKGLLTINGAPIPIPMGAFQ